MNTDEKKRRRGRPAIEPEPETVQAVLDYLKSHRCTYVAACEAVGTSRHVMAKAMRMHPQIEFDVRLAVERYGPRSLSAKGADWALVAVVKEEAARTNDGAEGRSWEELLKAMEHQRSDAESWTIRSGGGSIIEAKPGEENF